VQPGEKLIEALEELRNRLNGSGVERTSGLLKAMDSNCEFYRKSLDIFIRKDYEDLKNKILRACELMNV
jgi:hypothetical protein